MTVKPRRKALEIPAEDVFAGCSAATYAEAEKVLGYKRPLLPHERPLFKALARLGIAPFDQAEVEKYQAEIAKKASERKVVATADSVDGMRVSFWDGSRSWRLGSGGPFQAGDFVGMGLRHEWQTVAIKDYAGAVPEYAVQRGLDVVRECPGARVAVSHLTAVKDPFLVVYCGDGVNAERFFIDVWDEPDFKAKRAY